MTLCNILSRTPLSLSNFSLYPHFPLFSKLGFHPNPSNCKPYTSISQSIAIEPAQYISTDTVETLLSPQNKDNVSRLMKMERKLDQLRNYNRWFPYLDKFDASGVCLSSEEVIEALDPHIMEVRKERFKNVVKNRSYNVCLVVEGLTDFGNVSAAFRSADALGFQSVHVVSCDSSKRLLWKST